MPKFEISGYSVDFPFEPYALQRDYMTKVIACLDSSQNGILESPTGTGKTLSLLCSTLGWISAKKDVIKSNIQKSRPFNGTDKLKDLLNLGEGSVENAMGGNWGVPKVIYSSRTHSQLTQAASELKRSGYNHMKAVTLGSRDQLCIHLEVSKEIGNSNKSNQCKVLVKFRQCSFHSNVESKKDKLMSQQPVLDIEDLVTVGRKIRMCPFYGARELLNEADIIFMPYNYLLDPKALKANKIELSNSIVIIDEAHNVEKICEDSSSVQLKSSDVACGIEELTEICKALEKNTWNEFDDEDSDKKKDITLDDVCLLKEMLMELEKGIDDIEVKNEKEGQTYPAEYMFQVLGKANINHGNQKSVLGLLEKLIEFTTIASQSNKMKRTVSFDTIFDVISIVFYGGSERLNKIYKCFRLHVEVEPEQTKQKRITDSSGWSSKHTMHKRPKILNYWCFNPGFGMEQLLNKNIRSIILTSGTLAPLKPLIAELSFPVHHRLENPHIVNSSQVFVKVVAAGPDKEPLLSNYENRNNPKYLSSLARTILSFSPLIPGGLLVFFPSYPMMTTCVDSWQSNGLWAQISRIKQIFVEPRGKDAFNQTMQDYYEAVADTNLKGAIFLAVCRGKVSEGLDFSDHNGRAVIITGLPFPPLKDPKVILKKEYLNKNRTAENELLTGNDWYSLEASRAVNQAIGRVIRHRHDYGAILLCDQRFNYSNQKKQLSAWIQGHLNAAQSNHFGSIIPELSRFYKNAERSLPKKSSRTFDKMDGIEKAPTKREFSSSAQVLESINDRLMKKPTFDAVELKKFSTNDDGKKKFQAAHSNALSIENSNNMPAWTPEAYKFASNRPKLEKVPAPKDFMSRLEGNVKSIDFNSCQPVKKEQELDMVSIYKRDRNQSPTSSSEPVKKKRFKLAPLGVSPSLPSTSSQAKEKPVPTDRLELLKLIKVSISTERYQQFLPCLENYKKEKSIDKLIEAFKNIFSDPKTYYLCRAMRRFIRPADFPKFDLCLDELEICS